MSNDYDIPAEYLEAWLYDEHARDIMEHMQGGGRLICDGKLIFDGREWVGCGEELFPELWAWDGTPGLVESRARKEAES